jgi:hypothetical protein
LLSLCINLLPPHNFVFGMGLNFSGYNGIA